MKPNTTSINQYLSVPIYKHNLNDICFKLGKRISDFDREKDSELLANTWKLILQERKDKELAKKQLEKSLSPLYRHCIKYKVDCYVACCRFIEILHSEFIYCPERVPANTKFTEQEGYWWNKFVNKTGYFKENCSKITERMNIVDHREYILNNHLLEFYKFINKYHKILGKHSNHYQDYSSMAYNNSSDDF